MQMAPWPLALALAMAGMSRLGRMAMMAITTNNSMRVKARADFSLRDEMEAFIGVWFRSVLGCSDSSRFHPIASTAYQPRKEDLKESFPAGGVFVIDHLLKAKTRRSF